MSVGKASIKRASQATRKNTVKNPAAEGVKEVTEVKETAAVPKTAERADKAEKVSAEEKQNHRPVRLTEEMPTFLL